MSFKKPINHHPRLEVNKLGLTRRDYEGAISTLCAGCMIQLALALLRLAFN